MFNYKKKFKLFLSYILKNLYILTLFFKIICITWVKNTNLYIILYINGIYENLSPIFTLISNIF